MANTLFFLIAGSFFFINEVHCDYDCLCNYKATARVFPSSSDQGTPIGYLNEFDCKAVVPQSTESYKWITILFEHQIGYVLKDNQAQVLLCSGSPRIEDRLTTTEVSSTMMTTTTTTEKVKESTNTHSTTTITTVIPKKTTTPTTIPTTTTSTTTTTPKITTRDSIASTEAVSPLDTASKSHTATLSTSTKTTSRMSTTTKTTSSPDTLSSSATTSSVPPSVPMTDRGQLMCPLAVQQRASQEGGILFINKHDRTCYELVPHRHSWTYAEQDCQSKGGHLATIKDFGDEFVVYTHVKSNNHVVWIGLHDRNHEEHFEWSSGQPVIYTNWHAGRKDPFFHGVEDCVAIGPLTGTWEDMDCQDRYQYICEFDAVYSGKTNFTSTTPTPIGAYTDGNTAICSSFVNSSAYRDNGILGQNGQSCFELVLHSKVSWTHGENMCRSRGGHLAHISSAEEQGFIQAFMTRHMPQHAVWIGLHDLNVEGHFQWTSGNSVSYTNWVPGHMSNFESFKTEDCVAFIPYKNGQWDDIPCGGHSFLFGETGETHPILCQYDIQPSVIIG